MSRFSSFDRAHSEGAARVLHKLFPSDAVRGRVLEVLADSVTTAHTIDPNGWGVTLQRSGLRLNVGRGAALSLGPDRLCVVFDGRELDAATRRSLKGVDLEAPGRLKTAPYAASATLTGEQIEPLWPRLQAAHKKFVREAAQGFGSRAPVSPTWRDAHSPGVLAFLSRELGQALPVPAYAAPLQRPQKAIPTSFDAAALLTGAMAARGLSFPAEHLATFFTALSSKGLVILSGPSGVGKTALATAFAALLPQPGEGDAGLVRIEDDVVQSGRLPLPPTALRYLEALRPGETRSALVIADGAAYGAKMVGEVACQAHLQLRGVARKWLAANRGAAFQIETEWDDETLRPTFRFLAQAKAGGEAGANHLFLPVRPDWRDEKPLLGYFNPLGNRYEWTPFLRFLLHADAGFRAGDGLAYFVIFDEMNLARLEWYFADLLSILEAGRDDTGRTREPLRFDFDPKGTGELPPRELFLPPNLFFVGTINADESTQSLSPKVLDRAWVLEAPGVNFANYPPIGSGFNASEWQKRRLLELFTRGGRFAVPDKALIAEQLALHPTRRDELARLNTALEAHGAGFGFRVFDEILTFCAVARENELLGNESVAFDSAIALKIAPRLRGGRGQAEGALKALLEWSEALQLPRTAGAARKLLGQLERDGFLP